MPPLNKLEKYIQILEKELESLKRNTEKEWYVLSIGHLSTRENKKSKKYYEFELVDNADTFLSMETKKIRIPAYDERYE